MEKIVDRTLEEIYQALKQGEYLIQQALESVLEGRTALVIAHRLSVRPQPI